MPVGTRRVHQQLSEEVVVLEDEALTTIKELEVSDIDSVTLDISNSGNALDQFEIQGKPVDGSTYRTLFSVAGDYTSPSGILIGTSGDLTSLISGGNGWLILYPKGFFKIRFQAARAAGVDTTITANVGVS
jgi:hypothetical protein